MNSIDRATAGFDYALRRRFINLTLSSNRDAVIKCSNRFSPDFQKVVITLYEKAQELVRTAQQVGAIPINELVLGHAFFIVPDDLIKDEEAFEWLADSYLYQIMPTFIDYEEQGMLQFTENSKLELPFKEVLDLTLTLSEITTDAALSELITMYNK